MKEAVFEIFFSFFVKDGVPQGFFVQCCVYVCTNIYTQTSECVFCKRFMPPRPLNSTLQKRLDGPKMSKQTRDRRQEVRLFFSFLLTVAVFAVVLCGVRSHHPRLPLRPVLKSDPPPRHASDEGWKAFPSCGKEEGSDVVR